MKNNALKKLTACITAALIMIGSANIVSLAALDMKNTLYWDDFSQNTASEWTQPDGQDQLSVSEGVLSLSGNESNSTKSFAAVPSVAETLVIKGRFKLSGENDKAMARLALVNSSANKDVTVLDMRRGTSNLTLRAVRKAGEKGITAASKDDFNDITVTVSGLKSTSPAVKVECAGKSGSATANITDATFLGSGAVDGIRIYTQDSSAVLSLDEISVVYTYSAGEGTVYYQTDFESGALSVAADKKSVAIGSDTWTSQSLTSAEIKSEIVGGVSNKYLSLTSAGAAVMKKNFTAGALPTTPLVINAKVRIPADSISPDAYIGLRDAGNGPTLARVLNSSSGTKLALISDKSNTTVGGNYKKVIGCNNGEWISLKFVIKNLKNTDAVMIDAYVNGDKKLSDATANFGGTKGSWKNLWLGGNSTAEFDDISVLTKVEAAEQLGFYSNDSKITAIAGNTSIKARVKFNKDISGGVLVLAAYDGDGNLKAASLKKLESVSKDSTAETETLTFAQADGIKKIAAFAWDGATLTPLCEQNEIK